MGARKRDADEAEIQEEAEARRSKYTNLKNPEKYRQEIECVSKFDNATLPAPPVGKYRPVLKHGR